jgi:hypothetical protein
VAVVAVGVVILEGLEVLAVVVRVVAELGDVLAQQILVVVAVDQMMDFAAVGAVLEDQDLLQLNIALRHNLEVNI